MGYLAKNMYFEMFRREVDQFPPLSRNGLVTYSVIDAPNSSGKTSISRPAMTIIKGVLTECDHYLVQEPPRINLRQIDTIKDIRRFLLDGDSGQDLREPAAVFCIARRHLQQQIHGDDIDGEHFFKIRNGRGAWPKNRVVMSDRGMPSTMVFQVGVEKEIGGVKRAEEIEKLIKFAYRRKYLLPYDLTTFIQPSVDVIRYDPDDYFQGKWDEVGLYSKEINARAGGCFYSKNIVWVENDPTGATNRIDSPVISIAASNIAVHLNKKLELGKKYIIPFEIPRAESFEQPFTDGQIVIEKKFFEVRTGNVVVTQINGLEANFELTSDLPKMR